MLIKPRPLNLPNKERGKEKTLLVLTWLLEWRVSSLEIIAARIGLTPTSCTRFFKKLIAHNIIERITIIDSDKRDLVILGPKGHKLLGTSDIAYAAEISRVRKYTKKQTIKHDLCVQKLALMQLAGAMEMVSDFNVKLEEKKPDILIFRWNDVLDKPDKVAIEMEATAKDRDGIYFMLRTYLKLLDDKKVDEVRFYFLTKEDQAKYLRYFNRDMWPSTGKKRLKNGNQVPTTVMMSVTENDWRRAKFSFETIDPNASPVIFSIEEAAKLKKGFIIPYVDRIKGKAQEPLIEQALREEEKIKAKREEVKRLALEKEISKRNAVKERIGKRRLETASLFESLALARADDGSLKSWKPGYKFKTEAVLEKIIAHLTEHLERGEEEILSAYEVE